MARKSKQPTRRAQPQANEKYVVQRVQTGVRMEKRIVKVLKAIAEYHDISLGDLLEGIVLHSFEGKSAFSNESQERIAQFKRLYGLNLNANASHRLTEKTEP
jgi:predicted DNA-binding ribbon-helix-helix protein